MDNSKYSYQFYGTTTQAWEAMYQAILGAQKSIFWEVYIFNDDAAGSRFVDALCDKAKAGVEVKMIIDAIGSFYLSRGGENKLEAAGVKILKFNPLTAGLFSGKWFNRLFRRNHRKVLIVDEEIAFLGGVNIEANATEWDDVYLRLTGKLIRPLIRGFAKSFVSSGGKRKEVHRLLHPKFTGEWKDLRSQFNFILHTPLKSGRGEARKLYLEGLRMAKDTFNILTPYYIPDKKFLRAVVAAKKRGVKVNLFLPFRTDSKIMEWIARAYYGITRKAGADIYFLPKMNHGKAMSVDDKVGMVGSTNLTPRSVNFNKESGVYFNDQNMVNDLNELFNTWKSGSRPFDGEDWQNRGNFSRLKEWWARWLERFL